MAKPKPTQPLPFELVAFSAPDKVSADSLPKRLLVVPWGETQTRKGLVLCNATTLAQMPGNQVKEKFDRVALDFNHNTVHEGPEPKKVAAYGTPEVVEGEGIYLSAIEYTDEGKALLPGGHYPDISPAVMRNAKGEVILLHSVGACRQGEIDGLTLFSAGKEPRLSAFMAVEDDSEDEEGDDTPGAADMRAIVVALIRALDPEASLADDASDADLATAAAAAAEKAGKADETDSTTEANGSGSGDITAMAARLAALESTVTGSARSALVSRAAAEGKVLPLSAEQLETMDLTLLESMVSNLPATIPMESRLGGAVDDFRATPGAGLTPELKEVARQMGLDPKELVA